jgi:hypothetical protein
MALLDVFNEPLQRHAALEVQAAPTFIAIGPHDDHGVAGRIRLNGGSLIDGRVFLSLGRRAQVLCDPDGRT